MIKYTRLSVSNPFIQKHLMFTGGKDGILRVRDRYQHLACVTCGKFDEVDALKLGLESMKIKMKLDIGYTFDFCYVCKPAVADWFRENGCTGVSFSVIPGSELLVMIPEYLVEVGINDSGMQLIGEPCPSCGRYRETCFVPALNNAMRPSDDRIVITPSVWTEKAAVAMSDIRVSETVMKEMKGAQITGLDWLAMKKFME